MKNTRQPRSLSWWCIGLGAMAMMGASAAWSQTYPSKPVRLIAPFPPGGGVDIIARLLAQKFSEGFGVPFIVDNRPGAGGAIGTEILAKAPADGYTIGLVSGSHAINPVLHSKLPYDTLRDFASITMAAISPALLVVHPSTPARNVKELIALAKAAPRKLTYASPGNGTPPHLAAELFRTMAGVELVHVPYKGNAQVMTDLISGQVFLSFPVIAAALPHVKTGRLRGLAVSGRTRASVLPDMPTVAESGLPGFETSSWYALLSPAGTPPAVLTRLHAEAVRVLQLPDVRSRLLAMSLDPVGNRPEELTATIKTEMEQWGRVVKLSGARVE